MKKAILFVMITLLFSGCYTTTNTGQFIWDSRVKVYKVVQKGVTTFLTEDQIRNLKLDKAGAVIEYAYERNSEGKLIEDSIVENGNAELLK